MWHQIAEVENAGVENVAPDCREMRNQKAEVENVAPAHWCGKHGTESHSWTMLEWKTRHQRAGVENTGVENVAPDCRGGKCSTI